MRRFALGKNPRCVGHKASGSASVFVAAARHTSQMENKIFMSTVEEHAAMEDQPEEQPEETAEERGAREREQLRDAGILPAMPLEVSRSTFDTMTPAEQRAFLSRGWTVIDDPMTKSPPAPLQKGEIRRSSFDAMSSSEQMNFVRGGGKVADD
jgi:hypothetical protein